MPGIFIGALVGVLFGLICFGLCVMENKDRLGDVLFVICVCVSITGGALMEFENNARYIVSFEASKATIEQSLENENLTGYERVALVEQAAEKNAELAKKQYTASRWYGFTYPDEILELEPILLGGSEG